MNPRRLIVASLAAAAAAAWAGAAAAHHSFAMFDFSKDATLAGTIKTFYWTNPHIHILVDVPDARGQVQTWDIEGGTPNSLRPQGWAKTTLVPGQKVSLVVHPLKTGAPGGSLIRALNPDGSLVAQPPAGAPGAR